jgi:hypothetical protein
MQPNQALPRLMFSMTMPQAQSMPDMRFAVSDCCTILRRPEAGSKLKNLLKISAGRVEFFIIMGFSLPVVAV